MNILFHVMLHAVILTRRQPRTKNPNKQSLTLLLLVSVGMSAEQAAQAPDIFYRVDSSMTALGGFGLGLTVARSIIEAHSGTLAIESFPGKGTKVTMTLPL